MQTPEEQNKIESNETPKITLEKAEEKEISLEEFLNVANNEEQKFKGETTDEVSKLNSVNLDQTTFENIKNETGIEKDLNAINTESETVVNEAKEQVKNPQQKTMAEMRAPNITKKLKYTFPNEKDFSEANRIALKINDLIEALPEDRQQNASEKLRKLLTKNDIYFYKELHDEIWEEKKELNQPKQEIKNNPAEPEYANAINYQTVYINGELKNIQTQYFDQPDKIKVNLGHGWEIMSKDDLSKLHQESERVKNSQSTTTSEKAEIKIEESLSKDDALKEMIYTQGMSVDQIKAHMAKSSEERKRLRDSLTVEQENFENEKESKIPKEGVPNLDIETSKNEKQIENVQQVNKENNERMIPSAEEIVNERFLYKDVLSAENYERNKLWARSETGELKENQRQYAETYQTILKNESQKLETVKSDVKNSYNKIMDQLGIGSSIYGQSETWIDWDLAKQKYFFTHPEKSSENYNLADPFGAENQEITKDIVNRHVGWEILGYSKNNPEFLNNLDKTKDSYSKITSLINEGIQGNKLSSYKLAELGKLVKENKGI